MTTKQNFTVSQGETFEATVRWETTPLIYKPISGIANSAPVSISAAGHGIPNGWQVAIIDAKGLTELNATTSPPDDAEFRPATVVDANTFEFNEVSAAGFKPYKSGGSAVFYTPHVLTDYTARMSIKDRVGGTLLASLTTENGGVVVDATKYTLLLTISAAATALFAWTKGVYDLEMISPSGKVTRILSGSIAISKEATT